MYKPIRSTLVLALLISGGLVTVNAQAPSTITYQGRLTNVVGDPITSSQPVIFTIYPSANSPTVQWTETLTVSPDAEGVFTAILGTITALDGTLLNGQNKYITLKIGSDNEMLPRQLLNSVPYAISATNIPSGSVTSDKLATGAVVTEALADEAITTEKVADNSLTAADQLDEAGLVYKMSLPANTFKLLPSVGTDTLASITVNAPAAGYIYVWGMTNISFDHVNGTRDHLRCQVSAMPDTVIPNSFGFAMINIPADLPDDSSYILPVNIHRPFQVIAAGNYTYYFNAKMISGGGNNDQYHSLQLTAMFFPTAYGTVSQSPPPPESETAGDGQDFKN